MHHDQNTLDHPPVPRMVAEMDFMSSFHAVTETLTTLKSKLAATVPTVEEWGSVEIALAEILNNVAEHAFPESDDGSINLIVRSGDRGLLFQVCDRGLPIPGWVLPKGQTVETDMRLDDLPEGGFGWFLIRDIARDIDYQHKDGENRMSFRIAVGVPTN